MIVKLQINDRTIFEFKDFPDLKSESPLMNFNRTMKEYNYFFENGILILQTNVKKTLFINKKKKDPHMSIDIITMDLETRAIDGYMWPYCISIFDGINEAKSFYLLDYNDDKELMIAKSLKYLLNENYNKYKVFIHNFSYFDSIFLLKKLHYLSDKIKPIIRDGRFIDLKVHFNKKYSLNFRDSMLLLPVSLSKLSKNFNLENKGIFPYSFVNNEHINLNYIGDIPEYVYFSENLT
jgi:hypothetical protein